MLLAMVPLLTSSAVAVSFFGVCLTIVGATRTSETVAHEEYEAFLRTWGHRSAASLAEDKVSREERRALYESSVARIAAINALPAQSWIAGVNHFADYTHSEKTQLLGYKRRSPRVHRPAASSFIDTNSQPGVVANSVDWRHSLKSSGNLRNQGSCGSCWAVAAVGALEMHAEITEQKPLNLKLSHKQVVDCTPNLKHCGGAGGCQGATAELAYEYVQNNGLAADDDYLGSGTSNGDFENDCKAASGMKPSIKVSSFVTLPVNEYEPLRKAVQDTGPVVVSVDAGGWFDYQGGVFDGCKSPDATVNHAVLVVGYGEDSGNKYWTIRNSWGKKYGENGYIRLYRHDKEQEFCGTDYKPKDGVGCDGGSETLPVCGACGVLSDSSYPVGTTATHSGGSEYIGENKKVTPGGVAWTMAQTASHSF